MNHLGLLAKFWQPGSVKTRLADTIGPDEACELYQAFLNHLWENLAQSGDIRTLVYSPPERRSEFRDSAPSNWSLQAQSDGDLGKRLLSFATNIFKPEPNEETKPEPASKLVIIGADSPQITAEHIRQAYAELDTADAVITPSTDGGYCLIGMRQLLTPAFENIEWSSEHVMEQTLKQLDGYKVALTEPLTDVDHFEDLIQLRKTLSARTEQPKPDLLAAVDAAIQRQQLRASRS